MKESFQLSIAQIDHLFEFTRKKYVKYDDVRFEIVDHLASDIEAQMSEDSDLSFKSALWNVYSKFPITGFSQFIDEKEKAMSKYWRRKVLSVFIKFFTIPKIFLTVLLACAMYFIHMSGKFSFNLWIYMGLVIVYVINEKINSIGKLDGKNLLFVIIYRRIVGTILSVSIWVLWIWKDVTPSDHILTYLFIALLTLVAVFFFALFTGSFKNLLIEEFESRYSHLNLKLQDYNLNSLRTN